MPDDLGTLPHTLGIETLPPKEQAGLVEGFAEVALKAATLAILEKLADDKKREEFAALAETGDPATLQAFLDREVPDHEAIAGQAIRDELTHLKESLAS